MKRRSLALGFVLTALSGVIATATPGSTHATYRAAIYEISEDGKGHRLVAQPEPPVNDLVRSPGGLSILFLRQVDGVWALFAADRSGENAVRLSPPGVSASLEAAYSPDGRQIAFSTHVDCGFRCARHSLHVVSRDGSGLRLLAEHGASPSWASDSRRLAYNGPGGIHVIDTATTVSTIVASGYRPTWAPRGERIALNATRGGHGVACFVNADGSRLRCTRGRSLMSLVWSRDGKRVAFWQPTPQRLGIVDSNARHIRYLGNHGESARPAAWSPDGKRLAFRFGFQSGYFRALYVLRLAAPARPARILVEPGFVSDVGWRGRFLSYVAIREEPA
jgi:Tol biopolymer transport system component